MQHGSDRPISPTLTVRIGARVRPRGWQAERCAGRGRGWARSGGGTNGQSPREALRLRRAGRSRVARQNRSATGCGRGEKNRKGVCVRFCLSLMPDRREPPADAVEQRRAGVRASVVLLTRPADGKRCAQAESKGGSPPRTGRWELRERSRSLGRTRSERREGGCGRSGGSSGAWTAVATRARRLPSRRGSRTSRPFVSNHRTDPRPFSWRPWAPLAERSHPAAASGAVLPSRRRLGRRS